MPGPQSGHGQVLSFFARASASTTASWPPGRGSAAGNGGRAIALAETVKRRPAPKGCHAGLGFGIRRGPPASRVPAGRWISDPAAADLCGRTAHGSAGAALWWDVEADGTCATSAGTARPRAETRESGGSAHFDPPLPEAAGSAICRSSSGTSTSGRRSPPACADADDQHRLHLRQIATTGSTAPQEELTGYAGQERWLPALVADTRIC